MAFGSQQWSAGLAPRLRLALVDARIGFRSVLRQKRRSAFGISAVAFGVVASVLSGGFVEWIFWAAREGAIQAGIGHVQVMRPGFLDTGLADPFRYLLPDDATERKIVEALPGARTVAPRLSFSGLISLGDATLSFFGEGVDPEREARFGYPSIISQGEDLAENDPQGIIIGRGLAENLGAKVGDTVVLLTNTQSGGINAAEGRIRGVFTTVSKAYDDSAIRVPRALAQSLLRAKGAHRWIVVLEDTDLTPRAMAALAEQLPGAKLELVPWMQLADFYNKTVDLLSRQMAFIRLIIGVIIVLCISNTLTMAVMERTGEIGTTMALGATRASVLRRFLSEGLALGAVGGAIGVTLGVALALAISAVGIPMPPPPGMSQGYFGEIKLTFPLVAGAFALACVTALAASLYPAWKASRLVIVDALRRNI